MTVRQTVDMSTELKWAQVRWSLSIFTREPAVLPLLDSDPSLPHAIVFVPGLTDTFGTVPYLERLAQGVAPYGFSVVQLQLSSSLGGYGVCSLEGDAQEMALAVTWLREHSGKDKIILMGHSTGCQDAMAYVSCEGGSAARGPKAAIDGVILQAPVADREVWEHDAYGSGQRKEDEIERLELATKLVKEGRGYQLLPRNVEPKSVFGPEQKGNVNSVNEPPMTAYRWWSLVAKGGDDDYFSIDLETTKIRKIWQAAGRGLRGGSKGYVLALVGQEDEYIPQPMNTPEKIIQAWTNAITPGPDSRCYFEILPEANHKGAALGAQEVLVTKTRALIKAIDAPSKPPNPARASATTARTMRGPPPLPTAQGIPSWQLESEKSTSSAPSAVQQPVSAAPATTASVAPQIAAPTSAIPPHPPSFDALVEMIASGRTDEIEGIRDIPLRINPEAPSESQMEAPKKPWENVDNNEAHS